MKARKSFEGRTYVPSYAQVNVASPVSRDGTAETKQQLFERIEVAAQAEGEGKEVSSPLNGSPNGKTNGKLRRTDMQTATVLQSADVADRRKPRKLIIKSTTAANSSSSDRAVSASFAKQGFQQHQSRKRSSTASANPPTKRQQTIAKRSLQDSASTTEESYRDRSHTR